jgi:ketol-acid reductoisomerase
VALPEGSKSRERAAADNFDVMTAADASARADLVVMLAADEDHGRIYAQEVSPSLREGAALVFAHGLSIRFELIRPRADLDVILVAPKGPGTALRRDYERGSGLISLFAVAQDASGGAQALALSYAAAIGSGRVGILPTSFAEECEADLFNEQAVLWGAIPELIHAGYETLVAEGFSPEIAYFECLTEVKLLADLIYERGIAGMREAISNTAEFGALKGGARIVTAETRSEMRRILREVRAGDFTRELIEDAEAGYPRLRASRANASSHPIEETMRKLRALKK